MRVLLLVVGFSVTGSSQEVNTTTSTSTTSTTSTSTIPQASIRCWGGLAAKSSEGIEILAPTEPFLLGGVLAMRAGPRHQCLVLESGSVQCWPPGLETDQNFPPVVDVQVQGSQNSSACAITQTRTVTCWGETPPDVPAGLSDVVSLAVGSDDQGKHVCVAHANGTVTCFGGATEHGVLDVPTNLVNVTQVAAGGQSTCALHQDGSITCWGLIASLGSYDPSWGVATNVSVGARHACAILQDQQVKCWGDNSLGQTTLPANLGRSLLLSAGTDYTCSIQDVSLTPVCWGDSSRFGGSARACASCDAVLHLGGISGPGFVFDPPIPPGVVAATNVTGTMNLLEAARVSGVKRFVFASSVVVYWPVDRSKGWATPSLPESAPVDSTETYGASKIASEQLCRAYSAMGLLDTVSLRLGWVYGPRRTTACAVRGMLLEGTSATPGSHCRDWLYVDDAAEALILAALRPVNFGGTALNITGGYLPHRVIEGAVERAVGKLERQAVPEPAPDPLLPPMDTSTTLKQLGWYPRTVISQGVLQVAAAASQGKRKTPDLQAWLGRWTWDAAKCVAPLEYYSYWGTLSEEQAKQCATSQKEFHHLEVEEGRLRVRFSAADTTRGQETCYEVQIDGRPHPIDIALRSKANNSIKMNPTGEWVHWWEGERLIMEQPCVVRGEQLMHRLTRVVEGDSLLCHELVFDPASKDQRLTATMAFKRAAASA